MKNNFLKNKKQKLNPQRGFTLIEVMVAVGLFVTVILVGVGAVLNTNMNHKRTLAVRQVLDSVNFLAEDMARNIRLGSNYNCIISSGSDYIESSGFITNLPPIKDVEDCDDGLSIAFEPQGGDYADETDQMVYIIDASGGLDQAEIKKISSFDGQSIIRNVTPGLGQTETHLVIDPRQSGFTVIGSRLFPPVGFTDPANYDTVQPRVIIRLSGYIDYKDKRIPFSIQTTATQRLIDS